MSRFLAEAEWAALTHAIIATWAPFIAIAAVAYGLIAVPGWVSEWRRARRVIRQTEAEAAAQALDITQPITTPWITDPRSCGCDTRQHPRQVLTCPQHAQQQLIDLDERWRRREDAQ